MKFLIIYLFTMVNVLANFPPTTVKSQNDTVKQTTFNLEAPNYQATSLNGTTKLIETGNNNELVNPSFEHSTVAYGWSIANGASSSSSTAIAGKKSNSIALSGALEFYQEVSTGAAQKANVQMVASLWVNSADVSDLQLCSLKNGAEDKCTVSGGYVQGSGWRQLTISFIGDSTSNGLKLKSTDTTGTVLVDQAYVGIGSPIVDFAPDMVFSAKVSSTGVVSDENTDWINGNCTYTSGIATCSFSSGVFTQSPNCSYSVNTNSLNIFKQPTTSATQIVIQNNTNTSNEALTITCQKQGADYKTSKAYVASSSDFGYTNAGTITIGATTTAPTKGTIVTDRVLVSRKGQRLIAEYQFEQSAVGTVGSGDYLYTLPNGLSFDSSVVLFSTGNAASVATAKSVVGYGKISEGSTATYNVQLIAYDATRFRVATTINGTTNAGSFQGSANYAYSQASIGFIFKLDAPIQGWTDSGVIVGSFEGIEKCATANECNDTFSAKISSTGVVSDENTDWIQGDCTNANPSVCTFSSNIFTVAPNCTATAASSGRIIAFSAQSASSISIEQINDAGAGTRYAFNLVCQKQGADYFPKTAKVAVSTGVNRTLGVETPEIFSVSYGTTNATTVCSASPCSYLDQIGNAVSTVSRGGAGSYTINATKTYTKIKCSISCAISGGNGCTAPDIQASNTSTISFVTVAANTGATTNSYGSLICHGY